jgi:hypothetical protein
LNRRGRNYLDFDMPQRFLRPGITTSERWNTVPFECQSFYIRILTLVDDFGCYDGRASVLWGACFPVWNELHPDNPITLQQVAAMSQQLAAENLIEIYESEGKIVLQVTQWQERVREGSKRKWPKKQKSQQVAASRSVLLPPSPSPTPSPTPARAPSGGAHSFSEIPSWEEFWEYCQSPHCGLPAEWFARDKFQAAESDNWKGKSNWKAYAIRCKIWWQNDGSPINAPNRNEINAKPNPRNFGVTDNLAETSRRAAEIVKRQNEERLKKYLPK